MFIGRERELASLKEFYEKMDKKTIFYTATKVGKIEIWNCFQSR